MTQITNTTSYSARNPYQFANDTLTAGASVKDSGGEVDTPKPSESTGVKVSLSKDVEKARLREALGLQPTGRLTLKNFETVAQTREEQVSSKLSEVMEELGIDKDQKVSLSLDSENKMSISESFPKKAQLLKALEADLSFEQAFKQLSANQQIVDYSQKLTSSRASLADYFDKDSGWGNLMSMANKYQEIKTADKSMTTLLGISRQDAPYTYVHDTEAKEQAI